MLISDYLPLIQSVVHYDTLTRRQITRLHFPEDEKEEGRRTRRWIKCLRDLDLINATNAQFVSKSGGTSGPVYYPSADGVAYLNQELETDRFSCVNTTTPDYRYLGHSIAVAETHIKLDHDAPEIGATVVRWLGERELADPKAKDPEKRYRLYTMVSEKIPCNPDAGFLLDDGNGGRKVYFLEQDRDTTPSSERVAGQKAPGFAGMWEKKLHLRLFPTATVEKFSVLVIAPDKKRINALRKAFSSKPHCWLYKFASLEDLYPKEEKDKKEKKKVNILTSPVWYPCIGDEPRALKKGVSE